MDRNNVDFLRRMLERFPGLRRRLRLRPYPGLKSQGRWKRLAAAFPAAGGVGLLLRDGSRTVLAADRNARRRERFEQEVSRLAARLLNPWRPQRTLSRTDRLRSHTSGVVRILLTHSGGAEGLALAARPDSQASYQARLLSSAALWWSQRRDGGHRPRKLFLFIPCEWGLRIIEILPHLALPVQCWHYQSAPGPRACSLSGRPIYPSVFLRAALSHPYVMHPFRRHPPPPLLDLQRRHPRLDLFFRRSRWELSWRGYRVAWQDSAQPVRFGEEPGRPWEASQARRLSAFLGRLERLRRFPPPSPSSPFYRRHPERWMESLLLKRPRLIHPDLQGEVYCQVPTCLETDRAVVDALGRLGDGRLAVIEFKVEKDFNLLFQGLDYWDRVRRHLGRGDFQQCGYFAGRRLSPQSPLLILVAPLFEFHRLLPLLRGYLTREVEILCVGLNQDWRRRLRIVRRIEL
ncbi:MAG TPA: hypothetical protein VLV83_06615 [Acidobacteriota bacterium]|nr:hypothetical protein [Acidobacteriota bacterium]